jgi:hypothetical protein
MDAVRNTIEEEGQSIKQAISYNMKNRQLKCIEYYIDQSLRKECLERKELTLLHQTLDLCAMSLSAITVGAHFNNEFTQRLLPKCLNVDTITFLSHHPDSFACWKQFMTARTKSLNLKVKYCHFNQEAFEALVTRHNEKDHSRDRVVHAGIKSAQLDGKLKFKNDVSRTQRTELIAANSKRPFQLQKQDCLESTEFTVIWEGDMELSLQTPLMHWIMKEQPTITSLVLEHCNLGPELAKRLSRVLENKTTSLYCFLTSLKVAFCGLEEDGFGSICMSLLDNIHLRSLSLRGNVQVSTFGKAGKELSNLLLVNKTIKSIDFGCNKFSTVELLALCKAMGANHKSLKKVNMESIELSTALDNLAYNLSRQATPILQKLILSRNRILPRTLSDFIAKSSLGLDQIVVLDLSFNSFNPDVGAKLTAWMSQAKHVKELYLRGKKDGPYFGEECVYHILQQGLGCSSTLCVLDLSQQDITKLSPKLIQSVLPTCGIKLLLFEFNHFDSKSLQGLEKARTIRNKRLEPVSILL